MNASIFSIPAADGTRLNVEEHRSKADGPAVLLLHGITSHAGWYRWLGEELAAGGVNTYLTDRRGVGASEGIRGHVHSWRILVDDVVRIAGELERRHPGQPLQTIGISLGGAISLAASILHPQLFKSQVLLSPGLVPSLRLPLHRRLRLVRQALMQPTKLHDLPFSLADLSDRADWQKQAGEDPLRTRQVSARFAFETFRMQRFIRANVQRLRLPILALLAEKDTIINNLAVAAILSRTSAPRVRVETFEQAPHNLAVSLPRKEILDRLLPWLLQTGVSGEEGYTLVSVPPCPRVSETSPQPPPANVLVLPPQTEAALPEETDVLVLPPQTEAALPEETEGLSRA